jgi:hypothetical protein
LDIFFWLWSSLPPGRDDTLKAGDLNDAAAAISNPVGRFVVAFNEGNLQKFMNVFARDVLTVSP